MTLGDDGTIGNGLSRLSAATFELTDFANPTGSVTINSGSANDTLTVNGLPDLTAGLAIGSAAQPFATITFSGTVKLPAGKNRSATGGSVGINSGSNVQIEINGPAAGSQYGQLNVNGSVSLNGASLNLSLGYSPSVGTSFTIVNNDASDAIGGAFSGLPEGKVFAVTSGSFTSNFQITYQGGDGNDVVVTSVIPPTGVTATLAGTVLYVIGTAANDLILVDQVGSTVRVFDGSTVIYSGLSSGVESLYVAGSDGDDHITIDPSLGSRPAYVWAALATMSSQAEAATISLSGGPGADHSMAALATTTSLPTQPIWGPYCPP